MISQNLPILTLLILLGAGLIIPFLRLSWGISTKTLVLAALASALILACLSLQYVLAAGPYLYHFGGWAQHVGVEFRIDAISCIMAVLMLGVSLPVMLFATGGIADEIDASLATTYCTLVFIVLFSMLALAWSNDFFTMYVFLEILSISSCALISISRKCNTYFAAFRYLILNTVGSLGILMGIAMLYMASGSLNFGQTHAVITEVWHHYPINLILAMGFLVTGFGLKAALFPLHIRLPDVHASAPSPSSALLSGIIVKIYIFCLAKVLFHAIGSDIVEILGITRYLLYCGAISMVMGSFFGMAQRNLKRLLAYSSVAQVGYIFLGLGLASSLGFATAIFHLITHALLKSVLFLCAGSMIRSLHTYDTRDLDGVGYKMPITMAMFTIAALGMIGIPGTNGFISKMYLSFAAVEAGHPFLLVVVLLSSFLSGAYYFPIIVSAFLKERAYEANRLSMDPIPWTMLIPTIVLGLLCVVFGIFPRLIMGTLNQATPLFLSPSEYIAP